MFTNSLSSRLKSLDVYKNLPRELTEPTLAGALISIGSTILILILFISELSFFLSYQIQTEMHVDNSSSHSKLKVNMDISFPKIPCDILSLDVMDIMGNHQMNVGGNLKKQTFDKNGKIIKSDFHEAAHKHSDTEHHHDSHENSQDIDFEKIVEAFKEHQGCQLTGEILINKVPGNFHISAHAYGSILNRLFSQTGINNLDLTHTINHLSFGDESDISKIKKKFTVGVLSPLDGFGIKLDEIEVNRGIMHQYYLNVVPTTYVDANGYVYNVHQFTANENTVSVDSLSAIYFKYDLSPIVVSFYQKKEPFFHFLVQLCAIIGGVFTVAGIIDGIFHKSIKTLLKKAEINKLS